LQNIIRAFAHCADRYFDCPIYLQLSADAPTHDQAKTDSCVVAAT
jgi:hypothetical protein